MSRADRNKIQDFLNCTWYKIGRQVKSDRSDRSDRSDKPKFVCHSLLPVAVGVVFVGHSVFLVRRIVLRFGLEYVAGYGYGVVHTVAVAAAVTH